MPPKTAPAKPRKKASAATASSSMQAPRQVKAAVPVMAERPAVEEPVWLVRIVLVLFFVGFAAFLAREVYGFVQSLP
ncbi:MAG: hypothetical protein ACYC2H_07530 [Thermoplasmatota archaeon]